MAAKQETNLDVDRTNDSLRWLVSGMRVSDILILRGHHNPSQHEQEPKPDRISLHELKKGPHGRHDIGSIIYLRVVHVVPHLGSIITAIDHTGVQGEVWSLVAQPLGTPLLADMIISIRDPFYGEDIRGRLAICLHHPTDCRYVSRFSPLAHELFGELALVSNDVDWLADANGMFIAGRYRDAIDLCTIALEQIDASSVVQRGNLILKRAFCLSRLGAWLPASTDAGEATELLPNSVLALKLAMSSSLRIKDTASALNYAQRLLRLAPGNPMHHRMVQSARLSEQQARGQYDFAALLSAAQTCSTEDNSCSYTGSLEVRASTLGGRGMFAIKDIVPGELLLCEKAVAVGGSADEHSSSICGIEHALRVERTNGRVFALLQQLSSKALVEVCHADILQHTKAKLLNEQLFELHCSVPPDVPMDDHTSPFNTYRALSILRYNMHTILPGGTSIHHDFTDPANKTSPSSPILTAKDQQPGVWLQASMFNHSCVPNVMWSWIGDLFVARANRVILADEELTIAYLPNTYPHEKRNDILQSHNGFSCACPLCLVDRNVSDTDRDARTTMQDMLGRRLTRCAAGRRGGIEHVEKAVKRFAESYNYVAYGGLPKVGLADVFIQLANLYLGDDIDKWNLATAEMRDKAKECFSAVLRVGLKVYLVIDDSTGYCETRFPLHSNPKAVGVLALMGLAEMALLDKNVAMCRALKACAKEIYEIVYGECESFREKHGSYKCYHEPAQRCARPQEEEWQKLVQQAQLVEAKAPK